MRTVELTDYFSRLLSIYESEEYADNGLQVHASDEVRKIAFSVDASLSSFERAASLKADILIVHHGLFWGRSAMLRGYMGERVRFLYENNISLYAVHLPLDAHETLGNSAALVSHSGAEIFRWFAGEKGLQLGCVGRFTRTLTWAALIEKLNSVLGNPPVAVVGAPDSENRIHTIGTVTGGGMKFAIEAKAAGAEVFISGEPSHAWYHPVLESGIPCILYGHYATETLGLKKLQEHCANQFNLKTVFINDPTGM